MWECAHNEAIEGTHIEHLPQARQGWQEAPCYWLRGLPPLRRVYDLVSLPTQGHQVFEGCRPSAPIALPSGAVVATDGSGGAWSTEPRLCRCGWGFAVLDQDGEVLGKGHGPLHCWKQTVPLSELEGAKIALL